MQETICVSQVNKSFGENHILKNIDLVAHEGEIIGIVGRNGCGKTVLFKCICGLIRHDSGKIVVLGQEVGKEVDIPQEVGVLIENPAFLSDYTAFDVLSPHACDFSHELGDFS